MRSKITLLGLLLCLLLGALAPALVTAQDPVIVTTTTNLRIRAQPRVEGASLQVAPSGTVMAALGRTADGAWIQVEYKGVIGWASVFYLGTNDDLSLLPITDATVADPNRPEEQVSAPDGTTVLSGELIVFSVTAEVNVRVLPDEGAEIIGRLAQNERATVTLLDPSRLWGQINFQGRQGWVALYVVNVLGDIRTVEVLGEPAAGAEMPLPPADGFSLEQREIVVAAQTHYARYIPEVSGFLDILRNGANTGLIACGPVPGLFREYKPLRTDYARVPELEAVVNDFNTAFRELNRVRARWLAACSSGSTLLYKDQFPVWLRQAEAALPQLEAGQRALAELSAR
jgi:uncharacterized protein YraI